ncbi:MAG: hypothetical protein GF313_05520, partial [Caldithrix sp.]|nr:hypothetical protein [Caldithrix sp.]
MTNALFKVLLVLFVLQNAGAVDRTNRLQREISLEEIDTLRVNIHFGVGTLTIDRLPDDLLFSGKMKYKDRQPRIDYAVSDGQARLDIYTPDFKNKDRRDRDIDLSSLNDIKENNWLLKFSDKIPIIFYIETGASENRLHLGRLPIKS